MRPGISVVICTYNGASLLPETIRHVALQRVRPGISWEVIIVDNASTDNATVVAASEWAKYNNPVNFRVLYQHKQGLTYARELGLRMAAYNYVLFCDDDNWLNPDYVNIAFDTMSSNPNIGILGGHGNLVYEKLPPKWAIGQTFFANGAQGKSSGMVPNCTVYGAGCVIRKTAYQALIASGFKPLLTDRKGGTLNSGGDHELCYAIALTGYSIWYESKLTFDHFIPESRVCWDYYKRIIREGLQCLEVIIPYKVFVSKKADNFLSFYVRILQIFLSYVFQLLKATVKKVQANPASQNARKYTLQQYSILHKLKSFGKLQSMRRNYNKITSHTYGKYVYYYNPQNSHKTVRPNNLRTNVAK